MIRAFYTLTYTGTLPSKANGEPDLSAELAGGQALDAYQVEAIFDHPQDAQQFIESQDFRKESPRYKIGQLLKMDPEKLADIWKLDWFYANYTKGRS